MKTFKEGLHPLIKNEFNQPRSNVTRCYYHFHFFNFIFYKSFECSGSLWRGQPYQISITQLLVFWTRRSVEISQRVLVSKPRQAFSGVFAGNPLILNLAP